MVALGLAKGQANRLMIHGGMRYFLGGPKMAVQKLSNLEWPWPAGRAADFKLLCLMKWGVREIRKRPLGGHSVAGRQQEKSPQGTFIGVFLSSRLACQR